MVHAGTPSSVSSESLSRSAPNRCLHRKRDTAAEAYHTAVRLLKEELGIKPGMQIPEENVASIQDVHATVDQAKQRYDDASKGHTGTRKRLEKLSSRVWYYKPIMDTLAQHHPEYVALAWGTVKIVLMVC